MEKKNLSQQMGSFPLRFWMINCVEFLERFSYYCMRSVLGLYIVAPAKNGGLDLSQTDKGTIFAIWALVQCLFPIFSGGISDRYGYKKSLLISFILNAIGLMLMSVAREYWTFVFACILVAFGCGIFKPPIQAMLSHSLDKENYSLGWGIFYIVVNMGGFISPFFASYLRSYSWQYVFFFSTAMIILACPCLLLLESPQKKTQPNKSLQEIAKDFVLLTGNFSLLCFLLIYSVFYIVLMQVWDISPVFIDQWVESNHIVRWLGNLTGMNFFQEAASQGKNIPPELMSNLNTLIIILFTMPIAYYFGKLKHLPAMAWGMFFCALALPLCGFSREGVWCLFGIAVFSIGEIACSPKFSEYISFIAPEDKKALYLGFAQIPFAFAWAAGSVFTGWLNDRYSDIYALSSRHLISVLHVSQEEIAKIPRSEWLKTLAEKLGMSIPKTKDMLWETYYPPTVWYIIAGIGFLSILAMVLYNNKILRIKDK